MGFRKKLPNAERSFYYGMLKAVGYTPAQARQVRDYSENKIKQKIILTSKYRHTMPIC